MNVYIWTSGILKNDYIWEVLTETYTIAKVSESAGSYVTNYVSIYKSWYKIKNVLIETSWKSITSYWAILLYLADASGRNPSNGIWIYMRVGANTPKANLNGKYSWTDFDIGTSIGTVSATWTNTFSMNITDEWVVTTIVNWTTNNYTLTWNPKLALNNILNWTSIYWQIQAVRSENWPATVTVTYVPDN